MRAKSLTRPHRRAYGRHMAANAHKKWTLAELHRLPDDGNKYELVRGELFVTPAPTPDHEAIADVLARILDRYVDAQQLGRVSRPRSVIQVLRSEVEPDLMVRPVPEKRVRSWAKMPLPILVVEIMSESTRRRDHVAKRNLYIDAQVPAYWIVDGDERTVRVIRRGAEDIVASRTLTWHPAGAAEPLEVDLKALFREALG